MSATGDGELIRLCAEFDALERRIISFHTGGSAYIVDDAARQRAIDPIQDEQLPLLDRIVELRAITAEGWKARAATLVLYTPHYVNVREPYVDQRMIGALLRDMVAMDLRDPTAASDAELLALCAGYQKQHDIAHAADVEDYEEPLDASWRLADEIAVTPALTDVGRRAKAAMAARLFSVEDRSDHDCRIVMAVLRDLAGSAAA
jgi:hypothetical protein